jgi:putative membrane protein
MLWLRALHIVFVVSWFAGLFYLPRLFVYHAMAEDDPKGIARFKIMERKLYWGIMTPSAVMTLLFGLLMLWGYAWTAYKSQGWLHCKLALAAGLFGFHIYCGKLLLDFKHDRNRKSHVWYRFFNEVPLLFLVAITILVVVKPF